MYRESWRFNALRADGSVPREGSTGCWDPRGWRLELELEPGLELELEPELELELDTDCIFEVGSLVKDRPVTFL